MWTIVYWRCCWPNVLILLQYKSLILKLNSKGYYFVLKCCQKFKFTILPTTM